MMTPAILNPASTPAVSVSTAKQNAGGASGPAFGEVLSREVAGRGNPAADSKGRSAESRNAAAPGQPPADPATAKSAAGKSGHSTERDRDDGDAAAPAAAQWLMLAGVDAAPVQAPAAGTAAAAVAVAEKAAKSAAALLPLKSRQEPIAGDVMERLAVAAAALPDPAASLPATAAAIEAATSDAKTPPERTAARRPSAQESGSQLVNSTPARPDPHAAPDQPRALSSTVPTLAGDVSPLEMRAEARAATPPISALRSAAGSSAMQAEATGATALASAFPGAASAPKKQTDLSVAGPPPLQQAAFNNALTPTAPAIDKLAPQVGTSGWDQAVGQKVVWMAAGAQSSASLTLNPPDLGPLHVALSMANNQATVSFTAAQPEVRQALEAALPKLREMLGDAGIQMGQASVNAGAPQQHGGHGEPRQAPRSADPAATAIDAPMSATDIRAIAGRQGLIDTFA